MISSKLLKLFLYFIVIANSKLLLGQPQQSSRAQFISNIEDYIVEIVPYKDTGTRPTLSANYITYSGIIVGETKSHHIILTSAYHLIHTYNDLYFVKKVLSKIKIKLLKARANFSANLIAVNNKLGIALISVLKPGGISASKPSKAPSIFIPDFSSLAQVLFERDKFEVFDGNSNELRGDSVIVKKRIGTNLSVHKLRVLGVTSSADLIVRCDWNAIGAPVFDRQNRLIGIVGLGPSKHEFFTLPERLGVYPRRTRYYRKIVHISKIATWITTEINRSLAEYTNLLENCQNEIDNELDIEAVKSHVVKIACSSRSFPRSNKETKREQGTGIVIGSHENIALYLLTAYHVIVSDDTLLYNNIEISFYNDSSGPKSAKLIMFDKEYDIALLKTIKNNNNTFTGLCWKTADDLKDLETLKAISHPSNDPWFVTEHALNKKQEGILAFTKAGITFGSSGAPLFNSKFEIVGLITDFAAYAAFAKKFSQVIDSLTILAQSRFFIDKPIKKIGQ